MFRAFFFDFANHTAEEKADLLEIARLRLRSRRGLSIAENGGSGTVEIRVVRNLDGLRAENPDLFLKQGYSLEIGDAVITLRYGEKPGYINAVTSLKQILVREADAFALPLCDITDWPSVEHRAVSPTFSWYAGYGRFGFDMQLWGSDEWADFLDACLDSKINQMNLVMYGYWPFEMSEYPETVFRDVPIRIWNKENARWLTVRYSHPNVESRFLADFLALAHRFEVTVLAYVGLNSYNGAYSIKHPEKRMVRPPGSAFLNDFDSICLSDEGNIRYILSSMRDNHRTWFRRPCPGGERGGVLVLQLRSVQGALGRDLGRPVEAKHKANMWLLDKIYHEARAVNPRAVIGIRAFRQPPLEKAPAFLDECVRSMPKDVMLFWAPALYVPPTEFKKWIATFGKDRIWGRDTEANAITSTMGRLFRIFESNMIRYEDEPNVQVIERDIEQHISSAEEGVAGINGFMFEWYGLFMFLWAHGNYGWGSRMDKGTFFRLSCESVFGRELGTGSWQCCAACSPFTKVRCHSTRRRSRSRRTGSGRPIYPRSTGPVAAIPRSSRKYATSSAFWPTTLTCALTSRIL